MAILTSPHTRQSRFLRLACIVTTLLIGLSACEKNPVTDIEPTIEPTPVIDKTRVNTAADNLWSTGKDTLSASVAAATQLNSTIDDFLASPSPETLKSAQQKWQDAFLAYRRFYFFYFLGQTAPSHFSALAESHFRIAAHPIQPGYLDSFGPYLYSGIVHDVGMQISRENLVSQHGLTNSEDAVLGLYAIHFMLFGIDGHRAPTDYSAVKQLSRKDVEAGFKEVEETPSQRRRLLLEMQVDLLLDDLTALRDSWQSNESGSFYVTWRTLAPREKLNLVRQTTKQALTQLIVDVVELNKLTEANADEVSARAKAESKEKTQTEEATTKAITEATTEESTEESSFSYSNYPAINQQQFVLLSIESLLEAVPVLRKDKREQIEQLLLEINSILAKPFGERQENNWTKVYQNLKTAVDTLHQ